MFSQIASRMAGATAARYTFEPGWKWSECVKPVAGTDSCQVRHIGLIQSGRLHVVHDDGSEGDIGGGDAYVIEPGHDAWVIGDERVDLEARQCFPRCARGQGWKNVERGRRHRRKRPRGRSPLQGTDSPPPASLSRGGEKRGGEPQVEAHSLAQRGQLPRPRVSLAFFASVRIPAIGHSADVPRGVSAPESQEPAPADWPGATEGQRAGASVANGAPLSW